MFAAFFLLLAAVFPPAENTVKTAFGSHKGGLVVIDCATDEASRFNPPACAEKLAPCSTFKIWNTAIGLECGEISSPDEPFYKWDGVKRFVPDWNRDLTLQEAYSFSCVPAYQELARKIGESRMKTWIDRIGYGDRNISSGLDVFWLPAPGRKPLLISADEQAELIRKLVNGKLPFSARPLAVLKKIMTAKKTARGTLYGKTGTDIDAANRGVLGWYVGYVESGGKTYAFACVLKGEGATGKEARAIVEAVLSRQELL